MQAITVWITIFFAATALAAERKFLPNNEINPCDNFYQHVCSKEIEAFALPANESRYTFHFFDTYKMFTEGLEQFIKNLSVKPKLSENAKDIVAFYQSCTDKKSRIEEENSYAKNVLKEVDAIATRKDLLAYAAKSVKDGKLDWFSFENVAHLEDPKKWRIEIYIDWLTMPEKSYYESKEVLADLTSLIGKLFSTLKLNDANDRAKKVIDLESRFALAVPTVAEYDRLWESDGYWQQKEFQKKYPQIGQQIGIGDFPKKQPIHKYTPNLYDFVEKTLGEEDIKVLKDLIIARILLDKIDFSQPEFSSQYLQFKANRLGKPRERQAIDRECTDQTRKRLGWFVANEMKKELFQEFPKKDFTKLVEALRKTLVSSLENNKWLTKAGRRRAVKKIKSLQMALLYPSEGADWKKRDSKPLSKESFLNNNELINQSLRKESLDELAGPRDINAWSVTPLRFDASYFYSENRFYFPAAFSLVYDPAKSDIENFGGIGTYIAHELGHALDRGGSNYDEIGVKKSIFGLPDQKHFSELSSKFVEQFNRAGHNGEQTLSENIADYVGLHTSFRTAFPIKGDIEKQKKFFSSFAKVWCTKMTDAYKVSFLKEDVHALPESRVNEQLKLLPQFAQTYQCPQGSAMVLPQEKLLEVW